MLYRHLPVFQRTPTMDFVVFSPARRATRRGVALGGTLAISPLKGGRGGAILARWIPGVTFPSVGWLSWHVPDGRVGGGAKRPPANSDYYVTNTRIHVGEFS